MEEIKNKWERMQLTDVCEISPSKKEVKDLDKQMIISFLPMASVSENGHIIYQEERKLKDVIKGFTYFRDGDVLLAKITPCFENGKRALATDLMNGIGFGTTEFHVIRAKKEVTPKWIFYTISDDRFRNLAKSKMTGTAGQKRVPKRVLEEYTIPVPPIDEQNLIVQEIETQFTRLEAAVKSLKNVKKKLDVYRKSVLKTAFEGNLINAQFKMLKISDIALSVTYGTSKKAKETGIIPVIRMGNLQNGEISYTNLKYYDSLKDINDLTLIEGDILFNRTNSAELVGKTSIFRGNSNYNDIVYASYIIRIRVDREKIIPQYINYWLNSPQATFIKEKLKSQQVGQANINGTKLKNMEFPYTEDLNAQFDIVQEIESRFSVIDKIEQTIDKALLKTEQLRKSILKAAFGGRLVEGQS
ncbi:MAG: restriction endonuclease subunit S [bacterium]